MNDNPSSTVPIWFWVIAAIALLWNLMGCAIFAMELFAQEVMPRIAATECATWR